ncbi:MAG: 4-hydroxy-tetrahydrodipicolinate synthase [Lachnospiraceae bacterium]|nr:4-hydroxy-tetrahydrodipicolinate synthase [Lachnospiraceae bacterium]
MKREIFKGSAVALATPMDETGAVDYRALERLIGFQLDQGIDAVLVNGTTGESATLSDREKLEALSFVIDRVGGKVPVLAGTGCNNTAHAVELSREAEKLGADGLLVVTPYYNKASQGGLVRHYWSIADCVSLPILLYNVPTRTGVDIAPETYLRLKEHPNILGVKEAGGNLSKIAKTAALCGEDFHIYSGNDDQSLAIMALGGKGVISVLANVMPGEMSRMCRAFFAGDLKESRRLQLELLELMQAMFWDVNPIPVKAALSLMGMCGEYYRLPMTPMDGEKKERLEVLMRKHGITVRKVNEQMYNGENEAFAELKASDVG